MASRNSDPNTKITNRTDIFNDFSDDQDDHSIDDMDASKRMEAMMNMVFVEEDVQEEPTNAGDQEESMEEDEEDAFAFRLFSTDTVAKVSIKENHEETANALSRQIASQQEIDHDETDPTFLANIAQASISYDDIMQQSTWAYPALRLPKRVTYLPSASAATASSSSSIPKGDSSTSSTDKSKRKSKKRRDYEKAVKEGRITPKPNMRDPRTPGGWPGYPGARDPCAIINAQPYRGNRRTGGGGASGGSGFKDKQQGSGFQRGFGGGRGRGGGFGSRGRGRGAGSTAGGPGRFKKAVVV